jgi:two-component system, NtrC family, response regulator HydG
MLHALLFSDDTETIVRLSDVFRETGFTVQATSTLEQARAALLREMPDVALMDRELLGEEGLAFLAESGIGGVLELILASSATSPDGTAQAGLILSKPVEDAQLRSALERIATTAREPGADDSGVIKAAGLGIMHGESPPMRRLYALLRKVAPTNLSVMLTGESGVGKELAARVLHRLSRRSEGPLVAVNCGAVTAELLESELFGHEKGSFTGATRRHAGYFEQASGGTLFLDELAEMAPALQVKLLRVLETRRVRRVGGEREIPVDVRIVAATNRDLEEALAKGTLRDDLYYRLAQFPVRIPPLRDRGDDIVLLAQLFLAKLNESSGVARQFSPEVLELLRLHAWPGNVRELQNAVARAHVLAGETIEPDDLPPGVIEGGPIDRAHLRIAVGLPLTEVERRAILATVEQLAGDKKAAAKALGISLKTLYTKLKKYRTASPRR